MIPDKMPGIERNKLILTAFGRYLLYQLPGIFILGILFLFFYLMFDIPGWTAWVVLGGWVLKETLTLPFTWRLYLRARPTPSELLIGNKGVAVEKLNPRGYVKIKNEFWDAETVTGSKPINRGEDIKVCDVQGLRLMVEPIQTSKT